MSIQNLFLSRAFISVGYVGLLLALVVLSAHNETITNTILPSVSAGVVLFLILTYLKSSWFGCSMIDTIKKSDGYNLLNVVTVPIVMIITLINASETTGAYGVMDIIAAVLFCFFSLLTIVRFFKDI